MRRFRDGHKRIVAARQVWRCSACDRLLDSSFQVDHTVPLWKGGEVRAHPPRYPFIAAD